MLRPVGSLPPRVYWRRRVVVLAVLLAAILLIAITAKALRSGDSSNAAAASSTSRSPSASSPPAPTSQPKSSSAPPVTTPALGSAAVLACAPAQLKIVSAADKLSYKVGDQPIVALQVTNTGTAACSQALGDEQIEFRIYNGAARVWGSHDCKIDRTPVVETLPVNTTVAKTITWSGYSSATTCGTRQRVGAGTYTLTAYLAGVAGTPAQFAITG